MNSIETKVCNIDKIDTLALHLHLYKQTEWR